VKHLIVTWTCRTAGVVFIYAALFLYESEEGVIQNRLEAWLVRIRAQRQIAISYSVAIMNAAARRTGDIFKTLFGSRLFSMRSYASSICYGLASLSLLGVIFLSSGQPGDSLYFLLAFGICVLVGFVPNLTSNNKILVAWKCGVVLFIPSVGLYVLLWGRRITDTFHESRSGLVGITVIKPFLMFFASFLCDVLFIAFTRWMLKRTESLRNVGYIVLLLLLNVIVALALSFGYLLSDTWLGQRVEPYLHLPGRLANQLEFVSLLNLFDLFICGVYVLVLSGILLHRLLWPLVERPLYSLARFGVIKNKKLLWTLGTALLIGPGTGIALVKWLSQTLTKSGG
jgi:hypothetical protein